MEETVLQDTLVHIAFATACLYLSYRAYRRYKQKSKSGCDSDCTCPSKKKLK